MLKSTLTHAGKTTIPVKVRKTLELKPKQRLIYEFHKDGVLIKPETGPLMDLYGSFKSDVPPAPKKEERERARKERLNRIKQFGC